MRYKRITISKHNRVLFKQDELKTYAISLLNKNKLYGPLLKNRLLSRIRLKNYCILSGRARGVLRDFKLSRILLRKIGAKGFITGLRKHT
jgi:small subunit ribosomal protein S14